MIFETNTFLQLFGIYKDGDSSCENDKGQSLQVEESDLSSHYNYMKKNTKNTCTTMIINEDGVENLICFSKPKSLNINNVKFPIQRSKSLHMKKKAFCRREGKIQNRKQQPLFSRKSQNQYICELLLLIFSSLIAFSFSFTCPQKSILLGNKVVKKARLSHPSSANVIHFTFSSPCLNSSNQKQSNDGLLISISNKYRKPRQLFATSTSSPTTQNKPKSTTSFDNNNQTYADKEKSKSIDISTATNVQTKTSDASPLSQSLQRQQQNFQLRKKQEKEQKEDISGEELAKQIQQINSLTTLSSLEEIQSYQLDRQEDTSFLRQDERSIYIDSSSLSESNPSTKENVSGVNRATNILKQAYEECKRITSIYAKTFYLGTSFLEQDKRYATWAIYVWCRRTDDIVDSPRALLEHTMEQDLNTWMTRLDDLWNGRPWDSLDAALTDSIKKYPSISIKPFIDMVDGMVMDIPGHRYGQMRYQTFEELYLYCYRVAGTVGFMTLPIMGTAPGYSIQQAAEPALALGIALQLTNILRDVGEDATRGRIYLPLEDLRRFGVTEDQIMNRIMNSNYRDLIKFEIKRAREYYDLAETGIPMLAPDARLPVRASLDMYRKILDAIEENDYDNFKQRAYVSKLEKMLTLPMSWLKCREVI